MVAAHRLFCRFHPTVTGCVMCRRSPWLRASSCFSPVCWWKGGLFYDVARLLVGHIGLGMENVLASDAFVLRRRSSIPLVPVARNSFACSKVDQPSYSGVR